MHRLLLRGAIVCAAGLLSAPTFAQVRCEAQSFCDSAANSTGFQALLEVSRCSLDFVELAAEPVPDDFGIVFFSSTPAGGGTGVAFGNGTRCVGGMGDEIIRLPIQVAQSNRLQSSWDRNLGQFLGLDWGTSWYFQAWFRDSLSGGSGFHLSNGVEIMLLPPQTRLMHIILDDIGLDCMRIYDDQNAYDGDNPLNQQEDPEGTNIYPWTPTFDALAEKGIRFNQYRSNPTCSTTRACMATGRYGFRHGVGSLIADNRIGELAEFGVGAGNDEYTLAQIAAVGTYRTGFTGKWHLALHDSQDALGGLPGLSYEHVFDFGRYEDAWVLLENLDGVYFPPPVNIPGVSGGTEPQNDVIRGYWNYYSYASFGPEAGTEVWNQGVYATQRQMQATYELIQEFENTGSAPWLMTVALSAAHSPYGDVPPPDWVSTTEYLPAVSPYGLPVPSGSGVQTAWRGHQQLIESLDYQLGQLFDQLGGLDNLLEDTLVIVSGDNGTTTPVMASAALQHGKDIGSVYSLFTTNETSHFKHTCYELGIRSPLIVAGPPVADPGRTSDALIDAVDIAATLAELTGVVPAEVTDGRTQDGVSFLPLLDGTRTDVEHVQQARYFSFAERFSPNGDPRTITPPIFNQNSRRRGFMTRTPNGWFKLVRRLGQDGLEDDELYHLYDGEVPSMMTAVDPFELVDLRDDATYLLDYLQVAFQLEELLDSEL